MPRHAPHISILGRTITERYADPEATLDVVSDVLGVQLAHRSVRRFLPGDPVDDRRLHAIVAAAQSAPISSNLQAWSVIAVGDPDRKRRLSALTNDQRCIVDAPLFPVWVADLGRARRIAARRAVALDAANYLESTIVGFVETALAAQNAVVAAESLGFGKVFVGSVRNHPSEVADELGLPDHAVATFGLAIGRPDPTEPAGVKPRLPQAAVLHHETYDAESADSHVEAYDEVLSGYYRRHGLDGDWSTRVLTRLADAE
ncbi:NADPH-dependent oxidoreductase [Gordonia sp. NPDC058843]|uniref:NADPH-dependent oxidoreductase n=1 Tax=Gordonia sp. NPDC058843 TaxID=3346648 RepID=UPI003674F4A1